MSLGSVETEKKNSDPARRRFCLTDARQEAQRLAVFVQKGIDPRTATLVEKEESKREMLEAERRIKEEERQGTTFRQFWDDVFLPTRKKLKKRTRDSNKAQFEHWIEPEIGKMRLLDLSSFALEKICSNMRKAGQSPKSIKHAMGLISSMWTLARDEGYVSGDSPTRKIKIKIENRRVRFLSRREADRLLTELKSVSRDTYDITLMALRTGARFGELAHLRWSDVSLKRKLVHFKDTKSGDSRHIPITTDAAEMLKEREYLHMQKGILSPHGLVFPSRRGKIRERISKSFTRTVDGLGFNNDIEDSRDRVCFHTLRHTAASWLVSEGVALYKVGKLLGHSETKTTERYSHLAPDSFKDVIDVLERSSEAGEKVLPFEPKAENDQ